MRRPSCSILVSRLGCSAAGSQAKSRRLLEEHFEGLDDDRAAASDGGAGSDQDAGSDEDPKVGNAQQSNCQTLLQMVQYISAAILQHRQLELFCAALAPEVPWSAALAGCCQEKRSCTTLSSARRHCTAALAYHALLQMHYPVMLNEFAVQWHCMAAGCLVELNRLPQPVSAGCRPHGAAQALKCSTQA